MRFKSKADNGVAGLTILLSLVTMLFVIGFLVMIFALMGSELQTANPVTVTISANESIALAGHGLSSQHAHASDCGYASWNATTIINCTAPTCASATNETLVEGADYTINTNGTFSNITAIFTPLGVTYTYVWGGESCDVINDTTVAVADVTDWFAIFIVIGAMVVLILLTVIIITAIRGSGLMRGTG